MLTLTATTAKINELRLGWLGQIVQKLHVLADNFLHDRTGCSFECNAMLLGTLTKNMKDHGVLEEPDKHDIFEGKSVEGFSETVRTMRTTEHRPYYRKCSCHLGGNLYALVDEANASYEKLILSLNLGGIKMDPRQFSPPSSS